MSRRHTLGASAYRLGVEAARTAASWTVDGNTSAEHAARVLAMLDDGDPEADEYLPTRPNLSGEWADDLNPRKLFFDVVGRDARERGDDDLIDALADAFERGVAETFEAACEAELHKAAS